MRDVDQKLEGGLELINTRNQPGIRGCVVDDSGKGSGKKSVGLNIRHFAMQSIGVLKIGLLEAGLTVRSESLHRRGSKQPARATRSQHTRGGKLVHPSMGNNLIFQK
jgi:hypothetical protein